MSVCGMSAVLHHLLYRILQCSRVVPSGIGRHVQPIGEGRPARLLFLCLEPNHPKQTILTPIVISTQPKKSPPCLSPNLAPDVVLDPVLASSAPEEARTCDLFTCPRCAPAIPDQAKSCGRHPGRYQLAKVPQIVNQIIPVVVPAPR